MICGDTLSPVGAPESSPARERWGSGPKPASPGTGRKKAPPADRGGLPSKPVFRPYPGLPMAHAMGYSLSPLRADLLRLLDSKGDAGRVIRT